MTCKECNIVHGELLDKHGDVIGETEHIELCPRHSLTDRLAEATRFYTHHHKRPTCLCGTCEILREYDAKNQEKQGRV